MDCVVLGRVVDTYHKEFKGKDGKEVSYDVVTLRDEDAYMDKDRMFNFKCKPELLNGLELVGKYWNFKGSLTTSHDLVVFRATEVSAVK